MIADEKQRLRTQMRGILRDFSPELKALQSEKIRVHLDAWTHWQEAVAACVFSPMATEPDILTPWPEEKKLLFPRVDGESLRLHHVEVRTQLQPGAFSLLEPLAGLPEVEPTADVILVPGMAFDRSGRRLGRGGGYYDRFLSHSEGVRVGVCFEEQMVCEVPSEAHDLGMDFVITPAGIFPCGGKNTPSDSVE
jgi:5-formyltetrahydrofolate cyclo-ligase